MSVDQLIKINVSTKQVKLYQLSQQQFQLPGKSRHKKDTGQERD